jgi:hypothetical protein
MSEQTSMGNSLLNAVLRLMVFVLLLILAGVVVSVAMNYLGLLPNA